MPPIVGWELVRFLSSRRWGYIGILFERFDGYLSRLRTHIHTSAIALLSFLSAGPHIHCVSGDDGVHLHICRYRPVNRNTTLPLN